MEGRRRGEDFHKTNICPGERSDLFTKSAQNLTILFKCCLTKLPLPSLSQEKLEKLKELAFNKSLTKFAADVVYFGNFRGAEDWKEGGRGGGRQASAPTGQLDFNGKN